MSFLRNFTKAVIIWQGNNRVISATLLQQKTTRNYCRNVSNLNRVDADPKERSVQIDVETSIRYLNSEAFKETYGDNLIWTLYRRNKTRHFLSQTRKMCIRNNMISTGSPCPICRDMYLVLDYRNIKLLEQFISPHSGQILPTMKTGLCQKQHENLVVAILKAREYGLLPFYIPFRHYDYKYYKYLARKSVATEDLKAL